MTVETTPTPTTVPATAPPGGRRERDDLVETLRTHRAFLRLTVRDITDEQAAARTTVSELCLGGLVKHVAAAEEQWARFVEVGAQAMAGDGDQERWAGQFAMEPGEALADVLRRYDDVAARTDALVGSLPDLDAERPLPPAPWFEPGAAWSARRVLLHVVAETAQHAGHADVLREALDGARTMA